MTAEYVLRIHYSRFYSTWMQPFAQHCDKKIMYYHMGIFW